MAHYTNISCNMKPIFLYITILLFGSSCVNVKAYQKAYLNDEDMDVGVRTVESAENAFQNYREGASGANGGEVGGGCGCN